MSSFAVGNLISKEYQQWVIENMEENSYLLDLNDTWLCYLTARDNDIAWKPAADGTRRIPRSVAAISGKAPVFHLQHPEDHGWMYFAIYRGAVAGSLEIDYEEGCIREESGFESLALFGVSDDTVEELRRRIPLDTTDVGELFAIVGALNDALSTDIDFISYDYVSNREEDYSDIIVRK